MPTIQRTPNFNLALPYANRQNWTDLENDNIRVIDAVLGQFSGIAGFQGVWANSTEYSINDVVVDSDTGILWAAQIDHISSNQPTTFAEERTLHATYWNLYASPANYRGAWTGPGTAYNKNDFVLADGVKYAFAITNHVSTASFDDDVASGNWIVLVDTSGLTISSTDSITTLKALSSRSNITIVASGQAMGAWHWVANSVATADEGVVIAPTAGPAGRYLRIYDGAINIMWYGADNTGNTDTQSVLAAATAALPAAGGAIYCPRGSYGMANSFAPTKQGLRIYGDGWGNTIFIPLSDFNAPVFDLQGYAQEIMDIEINGTQGSLTITGAANNGGGLIRLTTASTASLTTGQKCMVDAVTGTTEANGTWTLTVVDATHIDLQSSAFVNAYVSGGTLIRYINVTGIKTSTANAANIIIENVFCAALARGFWIAGCNDGRINRIRAESCQIGSIEGQGGASVYASEVHFSSIVIIPYGQQGLGHIVDYNAFSNQHHLITVQGSQVGLTIQCSIAHNGSTILRPNGHYFGGDYNIDHAQLAAVSITSGWNLVFNSGTMTGTQAGPGLLISKSAATINDLDGVECKGVYIGGNGTHGVQWASGANIRLNNCRIYGNSVISAGTYNGIDVAAAAIGSLELKGNMYGPSAANTGGWGGLLAAQGRAIVLAALSLTDAANYGSVGVTLAGRLYIDEPYSVQTTGFLSDASAPTGTFKFIAPLVSYNPGFIEFVASGINFNSANTDTEFKITLPIGYTKYRFQALLMTADGSATTMTFGVFDQANGAGTAIVTSGTACTIASATAGAANSLQAVGGALTTAHQTAASLFFRVQTPQGVARIGSVVIQIAPIP